MSAETGISWTDSTFNPWIGCTKISPACRRCYAETLMDTRHHRVKWGAGNPRSRTSATNWKLPVRWNKTAFYQCNGCSWRGGDDQLASNMGDLVCPICKDRTGKFSAARRRVFCASLADVFDNEVPIEWLVDLLRLIHATPNLDWQLLTKRIGIVRSRLEAAIAMARADVVPLTWVEDWLNGTPPANVWLGATLPNQPEFDRDYGKLMAIPARVRFISMEPLLGAIDMSDALDLRRKAHGWESSQHASGRYVDWIIVGGESGHGAEPMHPDWVRSLRDQCAAAGVPLHFKQWGEWEPRQEWSRHLGGGRFEPMVAIMLDGSQCPHDVAPQDVGAHRMAKVGKEKAGRLLDGKEHNGFPGARPA